MSNFYSSHTLCSPYFMDGRFTTFTACLSSFFYSTSLYSPIPLRSLLEPSLSTLNPSPKINCHLISTKHSNSQVFALMMTAWTLWIAESRVSRFLKTFQLFFIWRPALQQSFTGRRFSIYKLPFRLFFLSQLEQECVLTFCSQWRLVRISFVFPIWVFWWTE